MVFQAGLYLLLMHGDSIAPTWPAVVAMNLHMVEVSVFTLIGHMAFFSPFLSEAASFFERGCISTWTIRSDDFY